MTDKTQDKKFAKGEIKTLFERDLVVLENAHNSYGDSWKKRGGSGAFHVFARKWDRIENQLAQHTPQYDLFDAGSLEVSNNIEDGLLDDIGDLRRYLFLAEAEIRSRGRKC